MNKYHAKRITSETGEIFDSKAEYDRWCDLRIKARAGIIANLVHHPEAVLLTRAHIKYTPDFVYTQDSCDYMEDVKGVITDRFRMIMQLWPYYGVGILRVVKRDGKGWKVVHQLCLLPGSAERDSTPDMLTRPYPPSPSNSMPF